MSSESYRSLPAAIEELLIQACLGPDALASFRRGALPRSVLESAAQSLRRISDAYVSRAAGGAVTELSEAESRAYALYYAPINFAKITHLLTTLKARLPQHAVWNVLDYGCGPGTASLAITHLYTHALRLTLLDSAPPMRALAAELLDRCLAARSDCAVRLAAPTDTLQGPFDLIVASHVFNELSADAQLELLSVLKQKLAAHGIILVLDTALRDHTRELMGVRDDFMKRHSDMTPLFPCTHRRDCPMRVQHRSDWCHGTLSWQAPKIVRQLDELTGFNKHRLKFSAFVFQHDGEPFPGYRVVSIPASNNAGTTALLCGKNFYGEARLLKRHRSESNREFTRAEVFDRIEISDSHSLPEIPPAAKITRHRFSYTCRKK